MTAPTDHPMLLLLQQTRAETAALRADLLALREELRDGFGRITTRLDRLLAGYAPLRTPEGDDG